MNRIEELIARDEIHQLAHRYALTVDAKDIESLSELFVNDVDNGRYGPGREGVKTFYDHRLRRFHCSMHLVANHVIDFEDDDRASGVVYCRAHHHVLDPEHWFDIALTYWDTCERADGRWLFRRRRVKSWYRQEIGHPDRTAERVIAEPGAAGPTRGSRMPESFPTFEEFWARPPRPLPESSDHSRPTA